MEISAASLPPPPPPAEDAAPPAVSGLPDHLWEQVFSFLPVSSLLVSRAVCGLWDAIIGSSSFCSLYSTAAPPTATRSTTSTSSSSPTLTPPPPSRWPTYPRATAGPPSPSPAHPAPHPAAASGRVHASDGALVLAEQNKGSFVVYDLFAGLRREIAPMASLQGWSYSPGVSYVLGLIDEGESGYKIVAVSTLHWVRSQVFDSETRSWAWKGEFLRRFAVLGNSAYLHGVLYCLSHAPDHLLAFDPISGEWSLVDVAMPSSCVACSHTLVHNDSLFLVGGEEEGGEINRIVMWELDRREKRWREFGCMPDELLQEFRGQRMNHFFTVDRKGVVCFCNTSSQVLLMCDLRGMRWWWPKKCPFPISAGHALLVRACFGAPAWSCQVLNAIHKVTVSSVVGKLVEDMNIAVFKLYVHWA